MRLSVTVAPVDRAWATRSSRSSSPGAGSVVLGGLADRTLPQQPEQLAHLADRRTPGPGDLLQRRAGDGRRLRERVAGALGLDDHHRQAVGDDVVHLAGDAGPLGGGGELGLLLALALDPRRPLPQRLGALARVPHLLPVRPRGGEQDERPEHHQHVRGPGLRAEPARRGRTTTGVSAAPATRSTATPSPTRPSRRLVQPGQGGQGDEHGGVVEPDRRPDEDLDDDDRGDEGGAGARPAPADGEGQPDEHHEPPVHGVRARRQDLEQHRGRADQQRRQREVGDDEGAWLRRSGGPAVTSAHDRTLRASRRPGSDPARPSAPRLEHREVTLGVAAVGVLLVEHDAEALAHGLARRRPGRVVRAPRAPCRAGRR